VSGPPGPSSPLRSTHIPALDGVRGIAVLIVMVLHFSVMRPVTLMEHAYMQVAGLGWAGVDLFFVLSGFLITGILLDARGTEGYFRKFYVRRALRIFPLFYVFLIFLFWVWPAVTGTATDPLPGKLWTLAYLGNFLMAFGGWEALPGHTTHLWSLAIEEQFYLVWPLLVLLLSRPALLRLCIGAIVLGWVSRFGFHLWLGHGIAGYALLPARVDALALGAVLAVIGPEPGWAERLRPWIPRAVSVSVLLLAVTWALQLLVAPTEDPFAPLALRVQLLAFPAVDLLSFALVAYAVLPDQAPGGVLRGSVLTALGKYSYALYLLHIPLRNLLVNRIVPQGRLPQTLGSQLPAQAALIVASILITYAVAWLSWHLMEKHFLKLKRYVEWRTPSAVGAPPPDPVPVAPLVVTP
jgi:peptidoglycan/LPS O-acetylase OafA/YrhL